MPTIWTDETISVSSTWSMEDRRFPAIYGIGRYGVSIYGDASPSEGVWVDESMTTGTTTFLVTDDNDFLVTANNDFIIISEGFDWINEIKS